MIDELRNAPEPSDGLFPEDWIASTVEANNPQREAGPEGRSVAIFPDGRETDFAELLDRRAIEMLGEGHVERFGASPGFLAKLLDSAIRLPIQAHPDNAAAKRLYGCEYGKTEAWIVLGTRVVRGEKPYLMMGFNEMLDVDVFKKEALDGRMPRSLDMIHKHEVAPGDVILLRGGLVHAIGPGVFMVEIMEPTDFVTQPESLCGEQALSLGDRFGDIPPEKALEVFDFTPETKEDSWNRCVLRPEKKIEDGNFSLTTLIDRNEIGFFGAERLSLRGVFEMESAENVCAAGVVVDGELVLSGGGGEIHLRRGEAFFIPASVEKRGFRGEAEVVFMLPPV
jgi:mannose-6-phosphate isomerase